ncbi:Cyst wall protein, type 1B [Carpediemonas membranifera]|uniref:Cyst wall protein, type 1B n=1 Tax=Carpediemonas membranifera TaxID=201153 RepID=A0A8J6EA04_9EUKA|nr:Cyst wall protein, type 1B [Carpediemonas membranifera]|eukprot:KAG9394060.1 Cyst wall protein, type 1B [Carpediemonas membranifera]
MAGDTRAGHRREVCLRHCRSFIKVVIYGSCCPVAFHSFASRYILVICTSSCEDCPIPDTQCPEFIEVEDCGLYYPIEAVPA